MPETSGPADGPLARRVAAVLDELRPFFHADGGDVQFVSIDGQGVVRVRLVGACHNCPSSTHTMQQGVLVALQEVMPEVTAVESV